MPEPTKHDFARWRRHINAISVHDFGHSETVMTDISQARVSMGALPMPRYEAANARLEKSKSRVQEVMNKHTQQDVIMDILAVVNAFEADLKPPPRVVKLLPVDAPPIVTLVVMASLVYLMLEKLHDLAGSTSPVPLGSAIVAFGIAYWAACHNRQKRDYDLIRDYIVYLALAMVLSLYAIECIIIPLGLWYCLRLASLAVIVLLVLFYIISVIDALDK